MLEVLDLDCYKHETLLQEKLSFYVQPGQVLQITGPNGVGKTTLLRYMAGILNPSQGQILWQGYPISNVRSFYQQNLHYISHQIGFNPYLSLKENLKLSAALQCSSQEAWNTALFTWQLQDLLDRPLGQLSRGQKQKASLARLQMREATLWLLDEPFTGLDIKSKSCLQKLIQQHVCQAGMVVLVSHHSIFPLVAHQTLQLLA